MFITKTLKRVGLLASLLFLLIVKGFSQNDIAVQLRSSSATSAKNGTVTFTVVVVNQGHTAVTGLAVTFPIPSGTTHASNDGGGAYNTGTGVWTIGNMSAATDSVKLNVY